jgi:coenzyme Q-binding protein COQ10
MPGHQERRELPYSAAQMFALVADVAKYPQFLPWCVGARVRRNDGREMVADLTIGFGPFRESFCSRVSLFPARDDGPCSIRVAYENGPFKYLTNAWDFFPNDDGCTVDFFVEFEFRSAILQKAIGAVFTEAVHRMVQAFLKRAEVVYGAKSLHGARAVD